MATVRHKKREKVYTYHEYVQKFRPKSLPKETEDTSDINPMIQPSHPVLDRVIREGSQSSPTSEKHR